MKKIIFLFLTLTIMSSCEKQLPKDLLAQSDSVKQKLSQVDSLKREKYSEQELKELVSLYEDAFLATKNYNKECLERGFERNNKELLKNIELELEELKSRLFKIESNKQNLLSKLEKNIFVNRKNDMFGSTVQTIKFHEKGDGKFYWNWSLGSKYVEGSSKMWWEIIDDGIIHLNYTYTDSETGRKTKEILKLKFVNDNYNTLFNVNDSSEGYFLK